MNKHLAGALLVALTGLFAATGTGRSDEYKLDAAHSGVNFKVSHLGLAEIFGRFNDYSGDFTIAPSADKCSFELNIKVASIDTNNKKRDEHLRGPDFFNVKQYPLLKFKSTKVAATKGGYAVTGDLSLHGVTKSVTFTLIGGRTAQFPKGTQRTGFGTTLTIKRSEFGMKNGVGPIGDDVHIAISFEGTKK